MKAFQYSFNTVTYSKFITLEEVCYDYSCTASLYFVIIREIVWWRTEVSRLPLQFDTFTNYMKQARYDGEGADLHFGGTRFES